VAAFSFTVDSLIMDAQSFLIRNYLKITSHFETASVDLPDRLRNRKKNIKKSILFLSHTKEFSSHVTHECTPTKNLRSHFNLTRFEKFEENSLKIVSPSGSGKTILELSQRSLIYDFMSLHKTSVLSLGFIQITRGNKPLRDIFMTRH
jgi:hypothetical protein